MSFLIEKDCEDWRVISIYNSGFEWLGNLSFRSLKPQKCFKYDLVKTISELIKSISGKKN